MDNENKKDGTELIREELEKAMDKVSANSKMVGARTVCKVILDKIIAFERTPGNKSNNDHKRLIKDIKSFCEIGLYSKAKNNNIEDEESETVQN